VITVAVCSTLIGSILGIRFRFVVLLPIIFFGSISLFAISVAQDSTPLRTVATIAVFAALLQFGYICAALFKYAVTPAHAGKRWSLLESPKL